MKLLVLADWMVEARFQNDSSQACTTFTHVPSRLSAPQKEKFLELKVSLYMSSWRHEIKDVLNIDNRKSMYFILTICLQFLFSFLIFTQLQDTGIWCIPCIGETEIVEAEKLICPWKHLRTCSYFKAKFKQMRNGSDETLRTLH